MRSINHASIGVLFALVLASAAPSAAHATIIPPPVRVPILIYHSVRPYYPGITNLVKEFTVPPDIFDDQMRYLRDNGYTPITLDELRAHFDSGAKLPAKPVIITFDDGWENQYRYAFPILQKYQYRAIFYIYPNGMGVPHFMTWPQVQEMSTAKMVIAGHSQSHPKLSGVSSDSMALRKELEASKKDIEAHISKTVDDFAYPFGDYNARVVAGVKQYGYKSARTVVGGNYQNSSAQYTLNGVIITGDFNRFVTLLNKR